MYVPKVIIHNCSSYIDLNVVWLILVLQEVK